VKSNPRIENNKLNLLIPRLVGGDVDAFSQIYVSYYPRLLRYGSIILPEPQVVGDVIQDLFVWILENPEKVKQINNLEVYVFQSLKKNLIKHIKRDGRSKRVHGILAIGSHGNPNENIEKRLIQAETHEFNKVWLHRRLDELPECQKEVIYLRYYEGLSYDEIAEVISKSNQVARNYASRALNQMRKIHNSKTH